MTNGIKIIIDSPMRLSPELCKRVIEKASNDTKVVICGSFVDDNYKHRRNENDNN